MSERAGVTLPEWADEWDGRKKCPRCKARLVRVACMMHSHSVCSRSGWSVEKCDGTDASDRDVSDDAPMQLNVSVGPDMGGAA